MIKKWYRFHNIKQRIFFRICHISFTNHHAQTYRFPSRIESSIQFQLIIRTTIKKSFINHLLIGIERNSLNILYENIQIDIWANSSLPHRRHWKFLRHPTSARQPQKLQQLQPRLQWQQQVKKPRKHEALIRWSARHDSSITAPTRCKRARIYIGFPSDLGAV